jgi:hypothetical protein
MKKVLPLFLIAVAFSTSSYAQSLKDLKKQAEQKLQQIAPASGFTEEEAGKALKEALSKGATKGTELVSKTDGYFGNPKIKIPFPPDAKKVEDKLRSLGLNKECDDVILSLNRAAEIKLEQQKIGSL